MEGAGWASLCWPLPGILPLGIVGKALTSVPAVSCVPHPLEHQRSGHSVSTVSKVPHSLSCPHRVWRGLREGGKEIQRTIVRQGKGDGFRNCLVKFSWEERGCFLLLWEGGGGRDRGSGAWASGLPSVPSLGLSSTCTKSYSPAGSSLNPRPELSAV